jgi:topoisomerase-4 subunit A
VRLKELHSRNRAGKALLKLREGALVLPPAPVPQNEGQVIPDARVALVNSEGRLLLFPVSEVPELPRGKGNKLFAIAAKKAQSRAEVLVAMTVLAPAQSLAVFSGERQMTLTLADLKDYRGARAQRGAMLPRGWRTVERIAPLD